MIKNIRIPYVFAVALVLFTSSACAQKSGLKSITIEELEKHLAKVLLIFKCTENISCSPLVEKPEIHIISSVDRQQKTIGDKENIFEYCAVYLIIPEIERRYQQDYHQDIEINKCRKIKYYPSSQS